MPAVWTYPWTLYREGLDEAFEQLTRSSVDSISVAAQYHSVQALSPRTPQDLFTERPGGCYFSPADELYDDTPISPIKNEVGSTERPFDRIVAVADEYDLGVNTWTVCLYNSRLGAEHPDYQIESAFGDSHTHSFCPSHGAVRAYFADVVRDLAARGIDEIQLESIGFPGVFHGHGHRFGHAKRQVLTTETEEVLLSQCFCDGCRSRATRHDVDMAAARTRVRSLLRDSFERPHSDPMSLAALVNEHDVLRDLFDFRQATVSTFLDELADASGNTDLSTYLGDPDDHWPTGVRVGGLDSVLDRAMALCYVSDPAVARDRLRWLDRIVDLPLDAGLTLDPDVISSEEELRALVRAVSAEVSGTISVYHHSLATETQLGWLRSVFR